MAAAHFSLPLPDCVGAERRRYVRTMSETNKGIRYVPLWTTNEYETAGGGGGGGAGVVIEKDRSVGRQIGR